MPKTWTRGRRRFLAAALVTLAAATAAAPASASTASRLKALEDRATKLEKAKVTLTELHTRLATTQGQFSGAYNSLSTLYSGFVGCLRRTPLFSYPGYLFDTDGGTITANITTGGLDWYISGGVVPSGVVSGVDSIHALSLANTPGCLAYARFRNPVTDTVAAQTAALKGLAG